MRFAASICKVLTMELVSFTVVMLEKQEEKGIIETKSCAHWLEPKSILDEMYMINKKMIFEMTFTKQILCSLAGV